MWRTLNLLRVAASIASIISRPVSAWPGKPKSRTRRSSARRSASRTSGFGEVGQIGPGVHHVDGAGIGEAVLAPAPWRSPGRTRSRARRRRSRRRAARWRACRGRRPRGCAARSRRASRPCAWSAASACSRRAPSRHAAAVVPHAAGKQQRRAVALGRRDRRHRRATAHSAATSVIAGLSALSTTAQPLRRLDRGVARHGLDRLRCRARRTRRGPAAPGF